MTTRVKDDAIQLFGFVERREQALFQYLLKVTGIGPKLALSIISAGSLEALLTAIVTKDTGALAKIPGVGKKLSQRLVLELAELIKKEFSEVAAESSNFAVPPDLERVLADLWAALLGLGYQEKEFQALAAKLVAENPQAELEELLRLVLRELHCGC